MQTKRLRCSLVPQISENLKFNIKTFSFRSDFRLFFVSPFFDYAERRQKSKQVEKIKINNKQKTVNEFKTVSK